MMLLLIFKYGIGTILYFSLEMTSLEAHLLTLSEDGSTQDTKKYWMIQKTFLKSQSKEEFLEIKIRLILREQFAFG